MKKTFLKSTFSVLALSALTVSCSSGLKSIKADPIDYDISKMPEKNSDLSRDEQKIWYEMDMLTDTVPGMSVQKAYDEIIKKHKGKSVIVGVLDSGVDIDHEDLKDVIWINKKEVADNGKDDDNNGYVDDVHGWNFLGDAVEENLEYTRIIKKLQPKYEGKNEDDIADADKEEYQLYKDAKEEYDKEYAEAEQNKTQYEQIKNRIEDAIEVLKNETGKETLELSDIDNVQSEDAEVNQSKMMLSNVLKQSGAKNTDKVSKELTEAFDHFNDKLKYHLNLDFDGRAVVGDDVDDIDDRNYGDHRVYGPEKDRASVLHGTHVAGIIGAIRNNDIGMNGVANNVELMPIRAVSNGDEYDKDIALGIRYAVDNGAKVINMSFGKYFSTHPDWVLDAIKYAAEHDVLLVNAAGNEGLDLDEVRSYPNDEWPGQEEIADNVITVGALNYQYGEYMVAPFSNYGKSSVDVFAPGMRIWATAPLNEYKFLQGTSMAAPQVAGIAGVIRSYFPKLTAAQVKQVIMDSGLTTDIEVVLGGDANTKRPFNEASKSGKIANLYNALIMASKM